MNSYYNTSILMPYVPTSKFYLLPMSFGYAAQANDVSKLKRMINYFLVSYDFEFWTSKQNIDAIKQL
jgi:hypothetical protein